MTELLAQYADASFIDAIVQLSPAVGWGFLLGIIAALCGWLWGFVIRIGKLEL